MNLFEKYPELGEEWFRNNSTMMIISGPNGEIYEANNEFLTFIGYSLSEFQRGENPISWFELTLKDEDFDTDKFEAQRLVSGESKSYRVRKHYIPKKSIAKPVELNVTRFPYDGNKDSFEFFVVEVYSLDDAARAAYREIDRMQKDNKETMVEISHSLKANTEVLEMLAEGQKEMLSVQNDIKEHSKPIVKEMLIEWSKKHPIISTIIIIFFILLLCGLLFGERAIELFIKIYELWGGSNEVAPNNVVAASSFYSI